MPIRNLLLALLFLAPSVWSMDNENTALPKMLALGVFAGAALWIVPASRLWSTFRHALPAHAFLIAILGSACLSPSPSFSWPAAAVASAMWLIAAAASLPQPPGRWFGGIVLAAAIPLCVGLAQMAGLDPTPWGELVREHFHGRACSTLGNPNFFSAFLAGSLPFLAAAAIRPRGAPGLLFLCLAGLSWTAVLGSGSKGGTLGAAAGLAVTGSLLPLAARPSHRRALWRLGGALLAGTVLALALMPSAVRSRLAFPGRQTPGPAAELPRLMRGESQRFRLLTWEQTARMVREDPLTGHGTGRFQAVYPRFRYPEIIRMFKQHSYMTDHPENVFLEIAAEGGALGLGMWLWLLVFLGRMLADRIRRAGREDALLACACAGGLSALLVCNSSGLDIHYGASAVLAACLAGIAASRRGKTPPHPRANPSPRIAPRALFGLAGLALALLFARIYCSDAALARALGSSSRGDWEESLVRYAQAIRLNPANLMARYFKASALLDRGRTEDLPLAESLLEGVRREAPDYVLLNYKFWLLYNRLGLSGPARAALSRQIDLDPLAAVFLLERGREALREGNIEEARDDFVAAIAAEPDSPAGYQYLGNLEVTEGKFASALKTYARGLERTPDSLELNYNAAVAAYRLGDRERAVSYARKTLALDPAHRQAQTIISRLSSR